MQTHLGFNLTAMCTIESDLRWLRFSHLRWSEPLMISQHKDYSENINPFKPQRMQIWVHN